MENPEIIVPTNFGMDKLDNEVEAGFSELLNKLQNQGWNIIQRKIETLEIFKQLPAWQFSCVESRSIYADQYTHQFDKLDPRVSSRMARANEVSAIDYCTSLRIRESLNRAANNEIGSSILLLPTVAILPPAFEALDDDDEYNRLNLLALRNTSMANVIDGCSISLPYCVNGNTLGAMLTTVGGYDLHLLGVAQNIEKTIDAIGLTIMDSDIP